VLRLKQATELQSEINEARHRVPGRSAGLLHLGEIDLRLPVQIADAHGKVPVLMAQAGAEAISAKLLPDIAMLERAFNAPPAGGGGSGQLLRVLARVGNFMQLLSLGGDTPQRSPIDAGLRSALNAGQGVAGFLDIVLQVHRHNRPAFSIGSNTWQQQQGALVRICSAVESGLRRGHIASVRNLLSRVLLKSGAVPNPTEANSKALALIHQTVMAQLVRSPRGSEEFQDKLKEYQQLLTSSDPTTRAYAQRWIDKLTSGGAGTPPNQPPRPTSTANECPASWNRNAHIADGRHRLQALRSLYAGHGDFMVPITAMALDRNTGRLRAVDCEVPVSELLKIRVNQGTDLAGRSATDPWQQMTPEQVRQHILRNPDLRIRVVR
jgi:hypothetical protein